MIVSTFYEYYKIIERLVSLNIASLFSNLIIRHLFGNCLVFPSKKITIFSYIIFPFLINFDESPYLFRHPRIDSVHADWHNRYALIEPLDLVILGWNSCRMITYTADTDALQFIEQWTGDGPDFEDKEPTALNWSTYFWKHFRKQYAPDACPLFYALLGRFRINFDSGPNFLICKDLAHLDVLFHDSHFDVICKAYGKTPLDIVIDRRGPRTDPYGAPHFVWYALGSSFVL